MKRCWINGVSPIPSPVQDDWTDCFTRNRYSAWWMAVRETLVIPDKGKLTQIPSNATGVPCPTCGVYFLDRSSMLVHRARPNIIKTTRAGHTTNPSPSTKLGMLKMAYISADTVTKRCVIGPACANTFRRNGAQFFLRSLCVKLVMHNLPWVLLWPHL